MKTAQCFSITFGKQSAILFRRNSTMASASCAARRKWARNTRSASFIATGESSNFRPNTTTGRNSSTALRGCKKKTPRGNVWVYINAAGKEIYPNLTEACSVGVPNGAGALSEGLRPHYSYADRKWGYIDAQGNVAIKPQFATARPFSEGLAAVQVEENYVKKWGFIDRAGAFVIPAEYGGYGKISDCRNGYVTWRDWDNSQDLFIDKTGKVVATYKSATPFSQRLCVGETYDGRRLANVGQHVGDRHEFPRCRHYRLSNTLIKTTPCPTDWRMAPACIPYRAAGTIRL